MKVGATRPTLPPKIYEENKDFVKKYDFEVGKSFC
jgi:hypothetical protein